ncbi:MAG: thermonuclease family protein [Chloracidobacterium sp.]|nr:thermonuclease family protein [Chloracidobacterium sp.]
MTRMLKIWAIALGMFLLANPLLAQRSMTGRVVGVLDGKTFVFETAGGRLHGSVQYIDVPEPEQPLSRLIREHLERMILNKEVTFFPNGFSQRAVVGSVLLDGRDVGQQLIRDGATWQLPPERSGQTGQDAAIYLLLEDLARSEKRGIWSIEGLTPPWEFRSRKDRSMPEPFFLKASNFNDAGERKNYDYSNKSEDMWVEVGGEALARDGQTGPVFRGYDPAREIRNTSTQSFAQFLKSERDILEAEVRMFHFQGTITPRSASSVFVIGILASSPGHRFAAMNDLTIVADGLTVELGPGQRFWRESRDNVQELLQYKVGRIDLSRLLQAKKVSIKLGNYTGDAGSSFKAAVRELLKLPSS